MKLTLFLKAVLFVVLVNYTAAAQEVLKVEADSIPVLEEWWRAPADVKGLGRSVSFLPNFYNGQSAIAIQVSENTGEEPKFHTWLNRFPGDTQNVFTWKQGYIKSGDFNGDGITDYVDGNGSIYRGVQNGMPPETEPVSTYNINGQIFDLNDDGYDDIYSIRGTSVAVMYGGPDLSKLVATNQGQWPNSNYRSIESLFKTPQGEFCITTHTYKDSSFNSFELYRATWQKGGTTPQFERLDSIGFAPPFMKKYDYYTGGVSAVYQSKQHDKTYLLVREIIDNDDYKNNIVIYDVTNDKFTEALRFRWDRAAFRIEVLNQSIDGDEYEDWKVQAGVEKVIFFSGGIKLDSIPRFQYNIQCSGGSDLVVPIGDVTEDGINDMVIAASGNFVPNCFRIVKGQAITTSIKESNNENQFSLKTFKTNPSHFTISFTLVKESGATFSLFDIEGKLVKVLKEGMFDAGAQSFIWDPGDLPQGAYLLQLTADGQTQTEKILIEL